MNIVRPNEQQAPALGEVLRLAGSCSAQVGHYGDGWWYIYIQTRKDGPIHSFYIDVDGLIHDDSPFRDAMSP